MESSDNVMLHLAACAGRLKGLRPVHDRERLTSGDDYRQQLTGLPRRQNL